MLLEKVIATQLIDKFPAFCGPEFLLPCLHGPAAGLCVQPGHSGPHLLTTFFEVHKKVRLLPFDVDTIRNFVEIIYWLRR
jgi:hypothetical protein